ncbi:MAG: M20/M25/M40 family metallo-hydrolase [Armatimonadota bacterium]|nr:M20/M25/M40 family metallo-hydrolase [Armatimonadota bacterium]
MPTLRDAAREQMRPALDLVQTLVRQPSVAATGEGVAECAALVRKTFEQAGGRVAVHQQPGAAPVVIAEFAGDGDRTLLFYNHYDVQPPDPLHEWTSPPFEPVVRDGCLYGRGVTDNKGDLTTRIAAVRAVQQAHGRLPCHVKFLVEGEEEIGSVHFGRYVQQHRDALRADACIWEFGARDVKERLVVTLGVKGICYLDMELEATSRDLHSSLGAIVDGAATKLAWALASLKDPRTGRVLVEGFYDRVRAPSPRELEATRLMPFDEAELKQQMGVMTFIGGVTGFDAQLQLLYQPTCTVCGFESGYTGPGSKTVLPRRARAKVDFRLVPDQDPEEITELVRRHFERQGLQVKLTLLGGERAYRTNLDDPFVGVVVETARAATGRVVTIHPTSAGTGPMYDVGHALGVPIAGVGGGYWGGRAHAPDENIRLSDFEETIYLMGRIIERFAGLP